MASHLLRAYWRKYFPNEKVPNIYFMNYGKEKNFDDNQYRKYESALKKRFSLDNGKSSVFDGKSILVIDEYTSTGQTVVGARDTLKGIFEKTKKVLASALFKSVKKKNKKIDIDPYFSEEHGCVLYKKAVGIASEYGECAQEVIYLKNNIARDLLNTLQRYKNEHELIMGDGRFSFNLHSMFHSLVEDFVLGYQKTGNREKSMDKSLNDCLENIGIEEFTIQDVDYLIEYCENMIIAFELSRKWYDQSAKELRAIGSGNIDPEN